MNNFLREIMLLLYVSFNFFVHVWLSVTKQNKIFLPDCGKTVFERDFKILSWYWYSIALFIGFWYCLKMLLLSDSIPNKRVLKIRRLLKNCLCKTITNTRYKDLTGAWQLIARSLVRLLVNCYFQLIDCFVWVST